MLTDYVIGKTSKVNSRLLSFWRVKSYMQIFNDTGREGCALKL